VSLSFYLFSPPSFLSLINKKKANQLPQNTRVWECSFAPLLSFFYSPFFLANTAKEKTPPPFLHHTYTPTHPSMIHLRPGSHGLDHWRRMTTDVLTDSKFASRAPARPIRKQRVDEQVHAGVPDENRLFGGLSQWWNRTPAEEKSLEDGSRSILRQKKLNMRRRPVELNVPVPLGTIDHPGNRFRFAEFIPSHNTSLLPAQYKTLIIDNEVQTGVQYPTDEALYMELPKHRLTFVDLEHPVARQPLSRITALATLNKVNETLYKNPLRYNSAAAVARKFGFLGTVDGIVSGCAEGGYSKDTSMINIHGGGEGAAQVDNIWLSFKGRQRAGTVVYLVLVRKRYPEISSLHTSVLMATDLMDQDGVQRGGGGGVDDPDQEDHEDGKRRTRSHPRYPPDGARYYWRYEPFASNDASIWDPPPASAYEGENWTGLYISLGVIKDIQGTVTGEKGKHDNDITKSLYPHEHATHHQGEAPRIPKCTIVLAY
jgi:hypothetical protein